MSVTDKQATAQEDEAYVLELEAMLLKDMRRQLELSIEFAKQSEKRFKDFQKIIGSLRLDMLQNPRNNQSLVEFYREHFGEESLPPSAEEIRTCRSQIQKSPFKEDSETSDEEVS